MIPKLNLQKIYIYNKVSLKSNFYPFSLLILSLSYKYLLFYPYIFLQYVRVCVGVCRYQHLPKKGVRVMKQICLIIYQVLSVVV